MQLKKLKRGDYFTRKQIEYPKESQVLVRDEYDRETGKYICYHWDDVNKYVMLKGTTEVFTDFTF